MRRSRLTPLLLSVLLGVAHAQDAALPVKISADQVEVDQKNGVSIYSGNVQLSQGELTLDAARVRVQLKDRRLDQIEASGQPARIRTVMQDKQPVEGSARTINYQAATGQLQLLGDGRLNQAGNTIQNDRIDFNLNTRQLKAGGADAKQRVEVILQPPAK